MKVDLSNFDNLWYSPGRGAVVRTLWYFVNALFMANPLNPSSTLKTALLRLFGARIGSGVVLKPGISVKYPWLLEISDHSWIGENVWLDCLAPIRIGHDVCISQGVYICTGNHDWSDSAFGLMVAPVTIEDGAWIGARATIAPGVRVGTHGVITIGTVVAKDTQPYSIYSGNPAVFLKERSMRAGTVS